MSSSEISDSLGSSSETANGNALSWMSSHWVMITMIIVGGILVLGLFQFINQFFNGTGPVSQGAGDVLNSIAHFVAGITNGCLPQDECTNEGSENDCEGANGCSWKPPETSGKDKVGICYKTTDKKVGEGSIFSPSCAIGFGFILYIGGTLILIGARLLGVFVTNKLTKDTAARSLQTEEEVIRNIVQESARKTAEALEKLNKEEGEVNYESIRDISRKITARKSSQLNLDSINGQAGISQEELNVLKAQNEKAYAEVEKDLAERAEKAGISEEEQTENDRVVDETVPHPHEI
jgi:uncharacterized protein YneF (UPF0154 family)